MHWVLYVKPKHLMQSGLVLTNLACKRLFGSLEECKYIISGHTLAAHHAVMCNNPITDAKESNGNIIHKPSHLPAS